MTNTKCKNMFFLHEKNVLNKCLNKIVCLFYISYSFILVVCWRKKYFAKLDQYLRAGAVKGVYVGAGAV